MTPLLCRTWTRLDPSDPKRVPSFVAAARHSGMKVTAARVK